MSANTFSKVMGFLADRTWPDFIRKPVIRKYIKTFGIDMSEYDYQIEASGSFNAFFTRKLKPGMRPIGEGMVSPVDGFASACGKVEKGMVMQVKGSPYSIDELLGGAYEADFRSYATLYLSPANYHRVHCPFDMVVTEIRFLPGVLYSVSMKTVHRVPRVYSRNERVVVMGESPYGRFAFVFVGAVVVGRTRLSIDDHASNTTGKKLIRTLGGGIRMKKGEELGLFELGSTVVYLVEGSELAELELAQGEVVKMGQTLHPKKY